MHALTHARFRVAAFFATWSSLHMDPLPYTYPRQGSQVSDNVPSRAAQLLVCLSPLTNPPSTPVVTPHLPVMLSPRFKRLLTIATALPLLALILVICTTLSPHWERVHFLLHRLIQRACSQQEKTTWRLAHVELEGVGVGGVRLFDNQTRWEMCQRWKEVPPTIVGVSIYNGSEQNATVIEVLYVLGGAFQVCKGKEGMQNNLIACVIVVFLCIISSSIVGAISVLARMVPAAMVNAYLYLTACVFIIFANCIEHIKVNHIQSKWGPCYPIVNLPSDLYDPTLIRVEYGWSVYVNWIVVGVFLASAYVWFVLKQFLYVETAKAMI